MDRKEFIKKGTAGLGSIIAGSSLLSSCKKEPDPTPTPPNCELSVRETAGPFAIITPADLVRANIVGDRTGVPMLINLTVFNAQNDCLPLEGVYVDIWHCDAKGNYSEYDEQLDGDFTAKHFLRGRQMTDAEGKVSFISIYPGWYPGRAPHIHLEVLKTDGTSLLTSEIALYESLSDEIFTNQEYNGSQETSNTDDDRLSNSLELNLADTISGDVTNGYTLSKKLRVNG